MKMKLELHYGAVRDNLVWRICCSLVTTLCWLQCGVAELHGSSSNVFII